MNARRATAEELARQVRLITRGAVTGVLRELVEMAAEDNARPLANQALSLIEQACATAEDQESGDDHRGALITLTQLTTDLITLLAVHSGP